MIVVTVELWPMGDEAAKTTLGVAEIANVGGDRHVGRYRCTLFKWGDRKTKAAWKKGWVDGFPRLRLGPWDLLFRCLRELVGKRNPEVGEPDLREPDLPESAASYWKARALEAEDKVSAMKRVWGTEKFGRIEARALEEIAVRDASGPVEVRRGSIPK